MVTITRPMWYLSYCLHWFDYGYIFLFYKHKLIPATIQNKANAWLSNADSFISCANLYKFMKHGCLVFDIIFFTRSSSKLTAPSSVKNVRLLTTSFGIGGNCSSLNGCLNRVTQTSSSSSNYDSNMLLFKKKIYIYIFYY